MQRMVKVILGLDAEPRSSHEADAFAVAICHALGSPLSRRSDRGARVISRLRGVPAGRTVDGLVARRRRRRLSRQRDAAASCDAPTARPR